MRERWHRLMGVERSILILALGGLITLLLVFLSDPNNDPFVVAMFVFVLLPIATVVIGIAYTLLIRLIGWLIRGNWRRPAHLDWHDYKTATGWSELYPRRNRRRRRSHDRR